MSTRHALVTPPVTPASRSGHYERPETRDKRPEGEGTSVTAVTAARQRKPKKRWVTEKRDLIRDLALAAGRHNQPPIPERAKDILVSAIGSLLNGGYPLELIRRVAISTCLEYDDVRGYSKLTQLRLRVRAEMQRIIDSNNVRRKSIALNAPQDPDTRAALLAGIRKAKAEMRAPAPSQVRCRNCGWLRDEQSCERCLYLASRGIA